MNAPANDRARAARLLLSTVHQGKTTDQSFGYRPDRSPSPLCQELVLGSLRHYFSLDRSLSRLLEKQLRSKDLDLRCLMLVGAYQLAYTRIPDHAAINETVNGCRSLRKPWAKGLVNAVLRRFADGLAGYREECQNDRSFELPEWIEARLRARFPTNADSIMAGLLERAPMSLRVNVTRIVPEAFSDLLLSAGITHQRGHYPEHILLDSPLPVADLPGYQDGLVSVQDGGALVAARMFETSAVAPAAQLRILDACAAPGGKLFHLAEIYPEAELIGIELSQQRIEHLRLEAQRLGHQRLQILQADATSLDWWDGSAFSGVLLDAPCSGVGTLRRHPDIKLLRQPQDLAAYHDLQLDLLRNLWRVVAPAGTLVYCTCSLFQEENDNVVQQFLNETDDAVPRTITAPAGEATGHGWQLLPCARRTPPARTEMDADADPDRGTKAVDPPDGFYYSLMSKNPA